MEYRSWVQGTTFCTRMDYLSPFFNEMTYVLGVERLLDIEDDIPEKAQVMRVLLMELNRISSHLVCIATGGMEIGALTVMTRRADRDDHRLPRARAGPRPVRADHRPADEPRLHPPRRCGPGPSARRPRRDPRVHRADEEAAAGIRRPLQRQPDLQGPAGERRPPPAGERRPPRARRLPGAGHHRPAAACRRLPVGPAQDPALQRLRGLRLRGADLGHLRLLRSLPGPAQRDVGVAQDRRAGRQPAGRARGGARDGGRQEDRLAQPVGHRLRRHGRPSAPTAWATASTTSATSWASRWRP